VQFGTQVQYLVDFYPLCEYLAAAGEGIAGNNKPQWMEKKKNGLKDNRGKEVLEALRPFLEPADTPDAQAPVRACFRYISNHSNFLDYQGALAAGLPMGSGEGCERPPLCISGPAQNSRWLVEDGKPKKDDCSVRTAREPRLGRLLAQHPPESRS
jgi:hypothetical protein